jgi:hypothetical protein
MHIIQNYIIDIILSNHIATSSGNLISTQFPTPALGSMLHSPYPVTSPLHCNLPSSLLFSTQEVKWLTNGAGLFFTQPYAWQHKRLKILFFNSSVMVVRGEEPPAG